MPALRQFIGSASKASPILSRHEQFLPHPAGLARPGLCHAGRGRPDDDPGHGHPAESRPVPGAGVQGPGDRHLRLRAGHLGPAGRLGTEPALRRHPGRQARHALGGAGRQRHVHRRPLAHRHGPGRPADRDRRRRADRRGAGLHDLGHHRQYRRPRRGAEPPDARFRHRLGGGVGRHLADRADRRLPAQPRRLAHRPVGIRHPGRRHDPGRLDGQPRRQAAQQPVDRPRPHPAGRPRRGPPPLAATS